MKRTFLLLMLTLLVSFNLLAHELKPVCGTPTTFVFELTEGAPGAATLTFIDSSGTQIVGSATIIILVDSTGKATITVPKTSDKIRIKLVSKDKCVNTCYSINCIVLPIKLTYTVEQDNTYLKINYNFQIISNIKQVKILTTKDYGLTYKVQAILSPKDLQENKNYKLTIKK